MGLFTSFLENQKTDSSLATVATVATFPGDPVAGAAKVATVDAPVWPRCVFCNGSDIALYIQGYEEFEAAEIEYQRQLAELKAANAAVYAAAKGRKL